MLIHSLRFVFWNIERKKNKDCYTGHQSTKTEVLYFDVIQCTLLLCKSRLLRKVEFVLHKYLTVYLHRSLLVILRKRDIVVGSLIVYEEEEKRNLLNQIHFVLENDPFFFFRKLNTRHSTRQDSLESWHVALEPFPSEGSFQVKKFSVLQEGGRVLIRPTDLRFHGRNHLRWSKLS